MAGLTLAIILLLLLLVLWRGSAESPRVFFRRSEPNHPYRPLLALVAGQHGNEPAGVAVLEGLARGATGECVADLLIVPCANPWGYARNRRETGYGLPMGAGADLNRAFCLGGCPEAGEGAGADPRAVGLLRQVLGQCATAVRKGRAVLLIDFHEGWGYHRRQPQSLGSTLCPSSHPVAQKVAETAAARLNATIGDSSKHFTVMPSTTNCEIPSTLVCAAERLGVPALLVETTGQDDIQPLGVRQAQVLAICEEALAELGRAR